MFLRRIYCFICVILPRPPRPTLTTSLLPSTTLLRAAQLVAIRALSAAPRGPGHLPLPVPAGPPFARSPDGGDERVQLPPVPRVDGPRVRGVDDPVHLRRGPGRRHVSRTGRPDPLRGVHLRRRHRALPRHDLHRQEGNQTDRASPPGWITPRKTRKINRKASAT